MAVFVSKDIAKGFCPFFWEYLTAAALMTGVFVD
jgi:hypothetical protein